MRKVLAVCLCLIPFAACGGEEKAAGAAPQAAAKEGVTVDVATDAPRETAEFLNTKLVDELWNPFFSGVAVKGIAEWGRSADGYASSLRLAADAVDPKGFSFKVTVNVDADVDEKVVAETKLAAEAARRFAADLAAQMKARAGEALRAPDK